MQLWINPDKLDRILYTYGEELEQLGYLTQKFCEAVMDGNPEIVNAKLDAQEHTVAVLGRVIRAMGIDPNDNESLKRYGISPYTLDLIKRGIAYGEMKARRESA